MKYNGSGGGEEGSKRGEGGKEEEEEERTGLKTSATFMARELHASSVFLFLVCPGSPIL